MSQQLELGLPSGSPVPSSSCPNCGRQLLHPSWCARVGTVFLVQDEVGSFHEVDVEAGTCSCDGFAKSGFCKYTLFPKVVAPKKTNARYTFKSALHKAIRRGDVYEALNWARWVANAEGLSAPKSYVHRIILEETRNVELLLDTISVAGKSYETLVRRITASPKKWELTVRKDVFSLYCKAYKIANAKREEPLNFAKFLKVLSTSDDLLELFEQMWFAFFDKDNRFEALTRVLELRAAKHGGWAAKIARVGVGKLPNFYTSKLLLEMFAGKWDESANEYRPDIDLAIPAERFPVILYPQNYVFDNHTRRGMKELLKFYSTVKPGMSLPGSLDMRWSGMLLGVAWRECAARQYPDRAYVDKKWEDVDIGDDLWKSASMVDRHFYKKFFGNLRRANGGA